MTVRLNACGRVLVFGLLALAVSSVPANASSILYTQPALTPVPSVRASQDQGPDGSPDFLTLDNFSFANDTLITGVDWQGSYFNTFVSDGNFNPPANSSGFVVAFYADVAGAPSALPLSSTSLTLASVNETFNRQEAFVLSPSIGLGVYDYSAQLTSSFLALGGTQYWISVLALSPFASSTEALWGWNGGTGGDGSSYQLSAGGLVNFDRALTLNGDTTPVPEPSTIVLLGTGALGLVRRLRRRARG